MEKINQNNLGKIAGAFLLGAVVGAVLGVLFAPDSGKETRRKIVDAGSPFADELKELLNGGRSEKAKSRDPEADRPV